MSMHMVHTLSVEEVYNIVTPIFDGHFDKLLSGEGGQSILIAGQCIFIYYLAMMMR